MSVTSPVAPPTSPDLFGVGTPAAPPVLDRTAGSGGNQGRHRRRRSKRVRIPSSLLSHGGWSLVVATTGVSGLNFVFHVLISRLLGPPQYGAFSAVLNIISVLAVPLGAVQLTVTQAVVPVLGRDRVSLRSLTLKAALWGVGAMAVTEALSPLTDSFLSLKSPSANLALGLWVPLAVVAAVLQGALLGELRFMPVAIATFVGGGALRLISGTLLVSGGYGVAGAVAATVIGQAFTTGVLLFIARREVFAKALPPVLISLRDTALSIGALAGCTTLSGIDVFLARHFLAHLAAGLYAAGSTAGHIAMFLPGALVAVAFPRLVSAARTGISVRKTLTETLGMVTVLGLAAFAVLAAMPGFVVDVLFGRKYADAAGLVGIIGLTSVLLGIISVLTYFYVARRSVAALSSWAGVVLVCAMLTVLHGGAEGVAVCMLVASGFVLLVMLLPTLAVVLRSTPEAPVLHDRVTEFAPAQIDLSLVIPFYNPGTRFASHVQDVLGVLRAEHASFEVIAVSDGSTDGSPASIAGLDQVRIIELPHNQGKGAALRAGLAQGRGRYLGFIDADGDIPARLLSHFLAAARTGGPDVVLGTKRHPDSEVVYPPLRRLYSVGYQVLNRVLFQLPVRDTQTGIKLIRREMLAAVLPKMVEKRFAFDLELLVVARRMGYTNFVELPVHIAERFTSTISLKSVRRTLFDTIGIFYRLRVKHAYGPKHAAVTPRAHARRPAPITRPESYAPLPSGVLTAHRPAGGPKRILAYNWRDLAHPRAGGAEVYLQSVAHEWVSNGHQVTLFCAAVEGKPSEEVVDGIRIIRRGGRVGVYREARRYWQEEGSGQYDLVLDCVNTRPFLCPRFVRDVPVVALIHQVAREVWHYEVPWPVAILGRYLLEPTWLRTYRDVPVVTVSQSSSESLAEYGLQRITVVPEGWVPAEQSFVLKEPVPTVAFVGRLSSNKRPDHAIRAFGLARREMPDAQLWVIGKGPEEARLRKMAGPGVTFFGHLPEAEKRDLVGRAHALVTTSVREGWGLVVTEAAASGTVAIGYDVAGLRDSIRASGGVLTEPRPARLAEEMVDLVSAVAHGYGPRATPAGVVPWPQVADSILTVMRETESPATSVLGPSRPIGRNHAAGRQSRLPRLRVGLTALGAALLLIGGPRETALAPKLVGAAFGAFLLATVIGGYEGWSNRGSRLDRLRSAPQAGTRAVNAWPSRIGLAIVMLVGIVAGQSWFQPGKEIAYGDMTPLVGTAWLKDLFVPWAWSGSNLGGPSANEAKVPLAALYWLVQGLSGSSALAEELWYIGLFAGTAVGCYLLLRALRIGPTGAAIGALAYVFNAHMFEIATNPVFLANMLLLVVLPAIVLFTASGRWSLRWGVLLLAGSAPMLGYASQNPPLVIAMFVLLALMPPLAGWLDGRAAMKRALRTLMLGTPLLTLASAYWIVPAVLQLKIVASGALADQSSWIWTENRSTLANGFWLNNDWAWPTPEYYAYSPPFAKFPLVVLIFALPVAAFAFLALAKFSGAGMIATRQARLGVVAAVAALFLVLFSLGTNFPGSLVFDPLYKLPLGWQLREPGRFLILAGLAYAILLGLTVNAVSDRIKSWLGVRQISLVLRFAAIGALAAAVLAPGFPLMTGAVAPDERSPLPSVHVSVPAYWTQAASYLNGPTAAPGSILVLPEDEYYQMPYSWGFYGVDNFMYNLINRNILDPITQGYTPATPELIGAVALVQKALLAHDWVSVQRTLEAMGTTQLLVRGDVDPGFPQRTFTPPAKLEQALRKDKDMQLVRRFGKLELFALRNSAHPSGPTTRYVTVSSAQPDLRALSLFPSGTQLLTKPMQPGVPAVVQLPAVSQWQVADGRLVTSISEPLGWNYQTKLLSPTGVLKKSGTVHSRAQGGPAVKVNRADGKVTEQFSYKLGASVLKGGDIASGAWGTVGNCNAVPGTTATAQLAANALPGQGPNGQAALSLSANADSACVSRPLAWKSGPLFVSFRFRNVHGEAPRICLFETPVNHCANVPLLPSNSGSSGWSTYQQIVKLDPGTRHVSLYLYADVYAPGTVTTNQYSNVVVRKFSPFPQPVIVATPRHHEAVAPLYVTDGSYSSGWSVPSGAPRVDIDGLRTGWLGVISGDVPRFTASLWYQLSRIISLVAAGLLLGLVLWPGGRRRLFGATGRRRKGRGHSLPPARSYHEPETQPIPSRRRYATSGSQSRTDQSDW